MRNALIAFLVLVVVAVGGVLFVPSLINWSDNRDIVESRLSDLLGRQVTIEGDVTFSMLPMPTLRATGLRVASEPGAHHGTLLTVGAIDLRVAMLPFLRGTIEAGQATLIDPVLTVERLPSGSLSIDRALGLRADTSFERIIVENGIVHWRDLDGSEVTASGVFGQISVDRASGPIRATGGFRLGAGRYGVELQTGTRSASGLWPVTATLSIEGSDAALAVQGTVVGTDHLRGSATLTTEDLAGLLAALHGRPAPEALDDIPATMAASIVARRGLVEISDLQGTVDGTRVTGSADLDFETGSAWRVELATPRIDLDAWRARIVGAGPVLDPVWFLGGLPDVAVPAGLAGNVRLAIDSATLAGGTLRRLNLDLAISDGAVAIDHFSGEFPGNTALTLSGALVGRVEAAEDGPGEDPSLVLAAEMTGDLRTWLEWARPDWAAWIPAARLRSVGLRGRLVATPRWAALDELELTADRSRMAGRIAVAPGDRMSLEAALTVDSLNIDSYRVGPVVGPAGEALSVLARPGVLQALVERLDLDLDLSIGSLTLDGMTASGVALAGRLADGAVEIDRLAVADLAGGSLAATAMAEGVAPLRGLDATVQATVADLPAFWRAIGAAPTGIASRLDGVSLAGRLTGGEDALQLVTNFELDSGTVALSGSITDPLGDPSFDLVARAIWPSVMEVVRLVLDDPAAGRNPGRLDLYGTLRGRPDRLAIEGLQGYVGTTAIAGEGVLDRTGARPSVEGRLSAGRLEIDPWIASRTFSGMPNGGPFGRWPRAAGDLRWLGQVDARVDLAMNALAWGGVELLGPSATIEVSEGRVAIPRLTGRFFDGALGLSGSAAATGVDMVRIDLRLDLVGAEARPAIETLVGPTVIDGEMDLALDVAGEGADLRGILATLGGTGHVAMRNGVAETVDLGAVSEEIGAGRNIMEFLDHLRVALTGGRTEFVSLNAPLVFDHGLAIVEGMRIVGELGVAEGRGSIDIPGWSLDLDTQISVYAHPEAPPVGIRLWGSLADPIRRLQTQAVQAYVAHRAAEALTERFAPAAGGASGGGEAAAGN